MKFLGRLGIICHVAYYYKGNVYTTSCEKKSKPVITRGKIKLFRSQNVMFQRNYLKSEKKIARGVVHINFGGKFQVGPF